MSPNKSFFIGWFYKLALTDFDSIFEIKVQVREVSVPRETGEPKGFNAGIVTERTYTLSQK